MIAMLLMTILVPFAILGLVVGMDLLEGDLVTQRSRKGARSRV